MSLAVKHLNADTTFLLSFTPAFAPSDAAHDFPGSFRILIDPWLSGHSSVWTPSFQISHHTLPPCIQSLTDIPEPDLIIISQDKPDHCHRETLCTLPPHSRVRIVATSAAAKKIRSWKHFKNATIESLVPYSPAKDMTMLRIPLPSYSSNSAPGEVTISYMPQKMDLTALHNCIGITYRSPGTTTIAPSGSVVNLPLSPPKTPDSLTCAPPFFDGTNSRAPSRSPTYESQDLSQAVGENKTLSVLYSPHGVAYSAIAPYASTHLVKESALPLTALFHSINVEENPWFMGGVVAAGYPGGEEIVRKLGAKCWISAHDEVKDNQGWSVTWIKSTAYAVEDAQKRLDKTMATTDHGNKDVSRCLITNIDCGHSFRVP